MMLAFWAGTARCELCQIAAPVSHIVEAVAHALAPQIAFLTEGKHDACAFASVVTAGSASPCSCTAAYPVYPIQPWPNIVLCVVQIGPVASGGAKPRLDSLEVYGKPRADVAASAAAESRAPAAAQISTEAMLAAAATSVPSLISPTPSDWTGMEYLLSQALLTAQSLWDALQGWLQ